MFSAAELRSRQSTSAACTIGAGTLGAVIARAGAALYHRRPAGPFQMGAVLPEQLDQRVHDCSHPRQGPEGAVDQPPLLGRDLGQHAADAAQPRVLVREVAGQHGQARSDAHRFVQDEPVVDPDLGPPAELLVHPALARHVAVIVVEAGPGRSTKADMAVRLSARLRDA